MPIFWKNERRRIADLRPAPYNPRQLSEKQVEDLGKSLERFDLAEPIVVNENGTIIGGHQRVAILRARGVEEVDVRVPDRQLEETEERELNLRLNANVGSFDWDKLAEFDIEFLKDVGFSDWDIDHRLLDEGVGDAVKEKKHRPCEHCSLGEVV